MYLNSAKCLSLMSILALFGMSAIAAADNKDSIGAKLDGYQVVSTQSSAGSGRFRANISRKNQMIEYQLSYQDLEGDILQSHIHFGRPGTNGGIVTFLCTNVAPNNDPSPTPAPPCPGPRDGSVTGTILPEDVVYLKFNGVLPDTQLIEAGEFDELVKAIDAGAAYVVVHTKVQPPGELRGNIPGREHERH